ncbi:MAG TPA: response regulator [Caulobacteraceae bacterium]
MSSPPIVLVVEDEEMIRMMAADMLDALGAGVIEAATAAEALDAARSTDRFDAAMIDLSLPDGLGDQLTLNLRALRPSLPVIIATGHDEGMISAEVRGLDRLVLLPKPYELAELDAALNRALAL